MTRIEFAEAMAWLSVAIGRPIADTEEERKARMSVYYECLGDLPLPALQIACKRCAMERKYQSFPPIAELRELATETKKGEVTRLSGSDAWGLAMKAIVRCDIESEGSVDRAFAKVPEIVRVAVHSFGFSALYNLPNGNLETARAQFIKLFESIAERERKTGLLPVVVQEQIASIGKQADALPAPVAKTLAAIGANNE